MENEPVEIVRKGRWVAETFISPDTVEHVAGEPRELFKMVVDELIDSIFDKTRSPVDLKIGVTEIRSGDYDPNTMRPLMPGWRCRIEGEQHRPGRQAIE